jgi:Papain-like cysteine protease AvrRpt2
MLLPFDIEFQTKSRWCWAATSKSVSSFYRAASIWTQCSIVSAELSLPCCSTPFLGGCNKDWYLDRALTRTDNYVRIDVPVSWQTIEYELSRGLVLGARVGWNGGGGHFMIIHGTSVRDGQQYLHIDDPISGKSVLTYNQFLTNYQGSGRWTHTYFTKIDNDQAGGSNMWYKNIKYNPKLLQPIKAIRSDLGLFSDKKNELYNKDLNGGIGAENNLPHYAYVIGLDQIINRSGLPKEPGSLRLFEMAGQQPAALYEVTLDENKPELIQMNTNKNYFSQLGTSLNTLQNNTLGGSEPGELRLLKLPALNLEAFWMHYDESKDLISPIKKFEADNRFDWNKLYTEDEFWAMIRDYAGEVDLSDDLLGG